MPLDAPDGGANVPAFHQVDLLAEFAQAVRGRRLKADEDAPAPGPRGQPQEFLVVREVDRGLGNPLPALLHLRQGAEQVLRTGDVFRARADEVVVHHQNMFLPDRLEFTDDIRNGPLTILGSVEGCHTAEAAIQRTAAGGLNGSESVTRG